MGQLKLKFNKIIQLMYIYITLYKQYDYNKYEEDICMRTETLYRILVGTVFVLLMVIAIYIGVCVAEKQEQPLEKTDVMQEVLVDNKDVDVYKEPEIMVKEPEKINVIAKYIDIYSECDHELNTSEQYYSTTMQDVKERARARHSEYSLAEESGNILVFERAYKGRCPNHFFVKIEDENLCIYKIKADGYELYQKTEIASELLREDLQQRLKNGIEANGLSELFVLLEDIEM